MVVARHIILLRKPSKPLAPAAVPKVFFDGLRRMPPKVPGGRAG
jgi:hypothetical protein